MVIESIALIIFIASFAGILFILVRKIPVLHSLPHHGTTGIREHHVILRTEKRIKEILLVIEKKIFLLKLLSWTKVMILKIETYIDNALRKMRKKAQQIDKDATRKNI